jgi:hypothetical protein
MLPCVVTNFFVIKPTRCTNFTNLFCHEILHVSDRTRMGLVPSWSCSKAVYKPIWHIPSLSAQWIHSWRWTDELSETCRISWQNKFVKLVRLVGFITKKTVPQCSIQYRVAEMSVQKPTSLITVRFSSFPWKQRLTHTKTPPLPSICFSLTNGSVNEGTPYE